MNKFYFLSKLFPQTLALVFLFIVGFENANAKKNSIPENFSIKLQRTNLEFDNEGKSRVVGKGNDFVLSNALELVDTDQTPFKLFHVEKKQGGRLVMAVFKNDVLQKTVQILQTPDFPDALIFEVIFKNISKKKLKYKKWHQAKLALGAQESIWGLLPHSDKDRPDWIKPLPKGYKADHFLGMNSTDFGGGTPVLAVWGKDFGVAIGSLSPKPIQIRFPVEVDAEGKVKMGISGGKEGSDEEGELLPGKFLNPPKTFVRVFKGDMFETLQKYSLYFQKQNKVKMKSASLKDIGPIWCAWGYGRNFTVDQVMKTIPIAKEMGFEWVGIDDGWQEAIGDWDLDKKKFPQGEKDMKALVKHIHDQGMKAQLWWAPLAAHNKSTLLKTKSDWLIKNKDGSNRDITWWDSWYLCPAFDPVKRQLRGDVKKFIGDWGFDGLKIDGQHLNASPDCHNPKHKHKSSRLSFELHSVFFKEIFESASKAKSDVLVETCPCGTSYSVYNLPFQNMTVAADPTSSRQVRQKGKVIKALTGDNTIYFGDHVEMSDGGVDFASTMAVGGLLGSNFTLPELSSGPPTPNEAPTGLTEERKKIYSKWLKIGKEKKLWLGTYLGELYDLGVDTPESHAVKKDQGTYYGFFAPDHKGDVELRGLKPGSKYKVKDYYESIDMGEHTANPDGKIILKVEFKGFKMSEAVAPN